MRTIKYGLLGALAAFIIVGMMFGIIGIACELTQRYPTQTTLIVLAIFILVLGFLVGALQAPSSSSDKGKDSSSKSS